MANVWLHVLLASIVSTLVQAWSCDHIRVNSTKYNIEKLGGQHSVYKIDKAEDGSSVRNHTFTFDICKPLTDNTVDAKHKCEDGSRVCAYFSRYSGDEDSNREIDDSWPIAGEFIHSGRALDERFEILDKSDTKEYEGDGGLRITLKGGVHEDEYDNKVPQMAIFDLICAEESGLRDESLTLHTTDDEGEQPPTDKAPTVQGPQYVDYNKTVDNKIDTGTLRISWRTKYACADQAGKEEEQDPKQKQAWGFFTWFIIVLFLAVAAYLIFGSWLNYNRHGARGWDLLPHADTIREIPYILKDVGRRIVGTVQGGSRGGYNQI